MLIPCPWCGLRDEREFDYGGSEVEFPNIENPKQLISRSLERGRTYSRKHKRGKHVNFGTTVPGCERWISLTRNTETHEFSKPSASGQDNSSETTDAD